MNAENSLRGTGRLEAQNSRSLIRLCIFVAAVGSAVSEARAQIYPSRALRIIVPFAAGGPNDAAARIVAEALRPHIGQSVVVENRGGAGGIAGTEAVATATPDGYTLLLGTIGPLVLSPSAKPLRYDPNKDLVPIGQIYRSAQVFGMTPQMGVKSVAELVKHAKAHPGHVRIGSAGIGTLPHLAIEVLKLEARVDVLHVPYRGTSAALTDLLGGQIDAVFGEVSLMAPYVRSGKLVALAITSPERSNLLLEVPTTIEAGFPALRLESWGGLLAPAGVTADVLSRLEQALQKALREPAFRSAAEKQGWGEVTGSREEFSKLLAQETAKWKPIVSSPGFRLD